MISELVPDQALSELVRDPRSAAWLDVRSEGEALDGEIPGFFNAPILNNQERHLVGTAYKQQGQAHAISLGHELTAPHRAGRVAGWKLRMEASHQNRAVFACWRGGLRSRTSAEWLSQATGKGGQIAVVRGGYKAMRHVLMDELSVGKWTRDLLVIAGPTGSGKTELLGAAGAAALDLEGLAAHRGSAFGRIFGAVQPSQATFENRLFLSLFSRRQAQAGYRLVLEDESLPIGDVRLPKVVYQAIQGAPVVLVEVPVEERARRLALQYGVEDSRVHGPETVRESLLRAVGRISRRLGGLRAAKLGGLIELAFARDPYRLESHLDWVMYLLTQHYDAYYRRSLERSARDVLFKGNIEECRSWLSNQYQVK